MASLLRLGSAAPRARAAAAAWLAGARGAAARFATQVVQVPKMGDSITEGTLIKLAKAPGDRVAQDEIICVIETDKVRRTPPASGPSSPLRPPPPTRWHRRRRDGDTTATRGRRHRDRTAAATARRLFTMLSPVLPLPFPNSLPPRR